jgi:hypothetical protein
MSKLISVITTMTAFHFAFVDSTNTACWMFQCRCAHVANRH